MWERASSALFFYGWRIFLENLRARILKRRRERMRVEKKNAVKSVRRRMRPFKVEREACDLFRIRETFVKKQQFE